MARTAKLDRSAQADEFGEVYRWLTRHHRRIGATVAKSRRPWAAVSREVDAAGVRNTLGAAPTAEQVRKVWSRVSRDLAKEQAAKMAVPAPPPRARGPNVEPPSRPGYSTPPPVTPRTYQQPRQPPPAPGLASVPAGEPARSALLNWANMTLAQRLAHQEALFDAVDGPRPIIKPRGKVS